MKYKVEKLHEELIEAGLPVVGCASDGRIDYEPGVKVTKTMKAKAKKVLAEHDPAALTAEEQAQADEAAQYQADVEALATADEAALREIVGRMLKRGAR